MEFMIATAILIVALTALLAVFAKLLDMNGNARNLSLAIAASQDKLEEIRNSNFTTIFTTYNSQAFNPAGFNTNQAAGKVYVNNTNTTLLNVYVSVSWRERSNRVIGEDSNLNGILNPGEDANGNNQLDSPAGITTLMAQR